MTNCGQTVRMNCQHAHCFPSVASCSLASSIVRLVTCPVGLFQPGVLLPSQIARCRPLAVPPKAFRECLDAEGRVAPGRCRPRAPTDPYVLALEHTVPQVTPSLRQGVYTAANPSFAIRWLYGNTRMRVQCLSGVARQRRSYSMPRFPSPGSSRAEFPGFSGTIKALRLPAIRPAALRFLRLAVPRERARFAPAAVARDRRRAWGWSPGIPVRVVFRGDGRISQVPGEPRFPFAHVLRPRPADTSLTVAGQSRGPR
jgi:hypothetical protein